MVLTKPPKKIKENLGYSSFDKILVHSQKSSSDLVDQTLSDQSIDTDI